MKKKLRQPPHMKYVEQLSQNKRKPDIGHCKALKNKPKSCLRLDSISAALSATKSG